MGINRGPNIVKDGLVLALDAASKRSYPGSGTIWKDLSGNGNHAFLSKDGNTNSEMDETYSFNSLSSQSHFSSTPGIQTDITSINSGSMWVVPGNAGLNPSSSKEWTVSGWAKHINEGDGTIPNNGTGWFHHGSDQAIHAEFHGPNKFRIPLQYHSDGINSGWSVLQIAIDDYLNKWTYYTITYKTSGIYATDSGDLCLYINGELHTQSAGIPRAISDSSDIWLGRRHGHMYHAQGADISSYMYYHRALSSEEVMQNYNAQKGRFNL